MDVAPNYINEDKAAAAFTAQSVLFDELYTNESIAYKRRRVRDHLLAKLSPAASMLELNCGTGEDALYFARLGFQVHATDLSNGMLLEARRKMRASGSRNIEFEHCSFTNLSQLQNRGPFDAIFSNFGGLNCTGDLRQVIQSFSPLLRPGGLITMVIISRFCLWETMLLFAGKFKTAFRRFFAVNGRQAQVERRPFQCWYYSPQQIIKWAQADFELVDLEALCLFVPPSYIENFPDRHPKAYTLLKRMEERHRRHRMLRNMGDYFIITLRKKVQADAL